MSITIEGSLRIKRINGSNGPFCVGDLNSEIGEFRVKDSVLDQFEEGVYAGRFTVSRIFPWSYSANGRMVLEVRAKLDDLEISDGSEQVIPESPQEPDPADEPKTQSAGVAAAEDPAAATETVAQTEASEATEAAEATDAESGPAQQECAAPGTEAGDEALFGEELFALVAEREPVKLDPNIDDRRRFRQQRDRLKHGLDYGFIAEQQAWYPIESEAYKAFLASRG